MEAKYKDFLRTFWRLSEQDGYPVVLREFEQVISLIQGDRRMKQNELNRPFSILSVDAQGDFSTFDPELLSVASDRYGIGYSGIGYKTADVRAVALARNAASEMVDAVADNAYSGEYPLSRFLYLYINYKPGSELDPLRREFLLYLFSRDGQEDVVKDGYYPVTAAIARRYLGEVGVELPSRD